MGAAGDLTLMENDLRDADEALAAELRKSEHRHLQLLWYWMGCVLDILFKRGNHNLQLNFSDNKLLSVQDQFQCNLQRDCN